MRRTVLLLASTTLAIVLASGIAMAAPSSFDASFGNGGRVVTDFAPPEDPRDEVAQDVAVQDDGKVVAAGYAQTGSYTDFAVARYNQDGSLDTSFGSSGKVTTDMVATDRNDRATALAVQPDDKIVVAGYTENNGNTYDDFAVARYNADGTLDTSFSTDGKVVTDASNSTYDYARDLAIQGDGKIVVVGHTRGTSYNGEFAVLRYNTDGTLDTSFDLDGKASTYFGDYGYGARAVGVQSDGKIVAAGTVDAGDYEDFALARYNTDGSLDNTFDGDGKLVSYITSRSDYAYDLVIEADDQIIVAGGANYAGALVKYNTDGSLDTSFGLSGKTVNTESYDDYSALVVQDDGKIVAQEDYSFGLWRYNADGTLDASFGGSPRRWGYETSSGLALQPDGKIVQAGSIESDNGFLDFAVARSVGAFADNAKPTGTVTIDNGRKTTKDRKVTLTLDANDPSPGTGVAQMRIRTGSKSWSRWLAYAETKDWNLTKKEGKQTVSVQFRDSAGNVSSTVKDTITYRR